MRKVKKKLTLSAVCSLLSIAVIEQVECRDFYLLSKQVFFGKVDCQEVMSVWYGMAWYGMA